MSLLYREYSISINNKKNIESLLNKEFYSDKTKKTLKISTTFFNNKTIVDFYDKEIWIRSKITANISLIIPFASLIIIIYLILNSSDFNWKYNLGLIFITIFSNYVLLLNLIESTHIKVQNYIFTNLYEHNIKNKV